MNKLNDEILNQVITSATTLFLEKSIKEVTIADIAKDAKIGEASLYRHFKTKQAICMQVATNLAQSIFERYFSFDKANSGYDLISDFYHAYLRIFLDKKEYFSFVKELDAHVLLETDVVRKTYENQIDDFYALFSSFYKQGVADGSLKEQDNLNLFYYTTTHALLDLCKSLATEGYLVEQDNLTKPEDEIKTLIQLFLSYIKKEA